MPVREIYIPDTEASERMGLAERLQRLNLPVRVGKRFSTDAESLAQTIGDAEILCVTLAEVDQRVIVEGRQLRLIVKCGIGTDNIDLEAAASAGVVVARTARVNYHGVAEYVIAASLLHLRKLMELDRAVRAGQWREMRIAQAGLIPSLVGKTLGVVGLGAIGCEVASLARAHGMAVVTCGPRINQATATAVDARVVSLSELLARSDIVTLHVPLNESTHYLIGSEELSLMKSSAILINTARGRVVDTEALVNALRSKVIAHAILDVIEIEPPPKNNPLLSLTNCTLTPHIAGCTDAGYAEVGRRASEIVSAYLNGCDLPEDCVVVPPRRKTR